MAKKILSKYWFKIGVVILVVAICLNLYFRLSNPRNIHNTNSSSSIQK